MVEEPAAEVSIEVQNLVKRYPKATFNAVDDISFSVPKGEIFGLLGPNGAGKTTTIGILTTNIKPTSGSARIMGINVACERVKYLHFTPAIMAYLEQNATPARISYLKN